MGWSPRFHTRFHVSCTTLDTASLTHLSHTRLSLSLVCFSKQFCQTRQINFAVRTPTKTNLHRFRLLLFRSPLLKESIFLSFPAGIKMFQFPAFPSITLLYSCYDDQILFSSRVSSFGYPRIFRYLLLPVAFRSLSRPSSALGAKSFTLRSQQLNLFTSH